jgi:predicted ArsR family transcriptional regulator
MTEKTTKERVLELSLAGMTAAEISGELKKSVTRVRDYRADLRREGLLPPYSSKADNTQVLALAKEGRRAAEIAAVTGLKATAVRSRISRLMAEGALPRVARRNGSATTLAYTYGRVYYQYGTTLGRIGHLIATTPPEQVTWLLDQIPEGGQLIDVLRGLIADAYMDEVEDA